MPGPGSTTLTRLAAEAVALLRAHGLSVATAEATTGGLIGHALTGIPGSSAVFSGGIAPYSNNLKRLIGVPREVLDRYGAVSAQAALALATAVCDWAGADVGVAETGIAGPAGGSETRPVGTFYIALAWVGGSSCESHLFAFGREENRRACAEAALTLLLKHLREKEPPSPTA